MDFTPLVDSGLGNTTWLVDPDDGRALLVDASRDLRAAQQAARSCGLTAAVAADTHLPAGLPTGSVRAVATPARAAGRALVRA